MSDRAAFLRAIAENRFSPLPRLVYADWLDEFGDDQPTDAKRAELIRANVYYSELKEEHKPVTYCDCDRCRLHRRLTEITDEMVNNLGTTHPSDHMMVWKTVEVGGFPVAAYVRSDLRVHDSRVGMEVARLFLAWPLTALAVQFNEPRGENVRWQMTATVRQPPIEGKDGAAVRVDLTPELLNPDDYPRGVLSADERFGEGWVSQDQWTVTKHRPAPTLAKVPDTVRKLVKRVAAERWSERNEHRIHDASRRALLAGTELDLATDRERPPSHPLIESMITDGWRRTEGR